MNKVVLVGRLTKDPELRFAAGSGNSVSKFTVAVNRQFKKDETDFISCVAFGKTAEIIAQHFTKGKQIAVSGSIRTGSYDAQDGTKKYTTDVAVDTFDFIGSGNKALDEKGLKDTFGDALKYDEDIMPEDDGDMPF